MKPSQNGDGSGTVYRVQVLERALGILELLLHEDAELTPNEICKRIDLHKSTAHRLLAVLEAHGFVDRAPDTGRYRLGMKLFVMGSKAGARIDMRERARPFLQRLALETDETAHLCILDEGESLYLEKVEGPRTVRVPSIIGRRYPAHCGGAGKTLLAYLPNEELERVVALKGLMSYTQNTIVTLPDLKRELLAIRERGYAVDKEEFEEGLTCIGAPVRDVTGKIVAAISIAGPTSRLTDDRIPILADSVVAAADELSQGVGYSAIHTEDGVRADAAARGD